MFHFRYFLKQKLLGISNQYFHTIIGIGIKQSAGAGRNVWHSRTSWEFLQAECGLTIPNNKARAEHFFTVGGADM
jgi:hypothetical protein